MREGKSGSHRYYELSSLLARKQVEILLTIRRGLAIVFGHEKIFLNRRDICRRIPYSKVQFPPEFPRPPLLVQIRTR